MVEVCVVRSKEAEVDWIGGGEVEKGARGEVPLVRSENELPPLALVEAVE